MRVPNLHFAARICLMFCVLIAVQNLVANCRGQQEWPTGSKFSKASKIIIGINWNQIPLRQSLNSLASKQQVAIFLDRRVDPSQLISFVSSNLTVEQTLFLLADEYDLGVLRIDERFFYVGPRVAVAELKFRRKALLENVKSFVSVVKQEWLKQNRLDIRQLCEPADLLEQISGTTRVRLSGQEHIAHDLWPVSDLPDLKLLDRMIVVSYGFGLWFELSEKGVDCKLVKAGQMDALEVDYSKRLSPEDQEKLLAEFPETKIQLERTSTRVTGTPIVHYEVERMLVASMRTSSNRNASEGQTVVGFATGDEGAEIGKILATVANAKNVKLRYDPSLVEQLKKLVVLDLKRVSHEELVEKALHSTGLKFQLTDTELLITR